MSAAMSKATRNTKIVKKLNFQESHIGQHYGIIYSFNAFYTCIAYLMFKGSIVKKLMGLTKSHLLVLALSL